VSRTSKLLTVAAVFATTMGGAASIGAALSQRPRRQMPVRQTQSAPVALPHSVSFREVRGRGLLISAWVNGAGPFSFAVDTGAGATIISPRVAGAAGVSISTAPGPSIAGLSGAAVAAHDGVIRDIAIGDPQNYLPAKREVIVSSGLPADLDGLLDPSDAFGSFGYVIDIPARELSAFDPRVEPVTSQREPADGAVVQWLQQVSSHRPFVRLDTGEQVLIDTGSSLGFAVHDAYARDPRVRASAVYDVGGSVSTRRGNPRTVSIGSLVLRNIPTDVISGAPAETPALLGLNALRPFRMRFDPLHRLIEIAPAER
jgi:predicted aspartyl protease